MVNIKIIDKNYEKPIEYYMDNRLDKNIEKKIIPALQKKDKDYVIVIDGKEGSGKTTIGLQIGKKIDPTLNLSRITFDAYEFREAIYKAKKGQVVIYDEAFTGLSSRSSLSGINRALVSLMMQMRQKNLCVILILPTIFLLDRYPAIFRSRILIHVYENHGIRGYFLIFNSKLKKLLYLVGKKDYSYRVRSRFKGRFYGVFALGDKKCEEKYREKKSKALESTGKDPMNAAQIKYRDQRNLSIYILRKITGLSYDMLSELFADYNFSMSDIQIMDICTKFGEKGTVDFDKTIEYLNLLIERVKNKQYNLQHKKKSVYYPENKTEGEKKANLA